jgi:hypothetical protein
MTVMEFIPDTLVVTQMFSPQYRAMLVPGVYTLGQVVVPEYPRLVVAQDTTRQAETQRQGKLKKESSQ